LKSDDIDIIFNNILDYTCDDLILTHIPEDLAASQWDLDKLDTILKSDFLIEIDSRKVLEEDVADNRYKLKDLIKKSLNEKIQKNLDILDVNDKKELMRNIFLSVIDEDWRNHLSSIDYLRQGVGLRSYAQKNPKNEYKRESFEMFEEMLAINNLEIIKILSKIKINKPEISEIITKDSNPSNKQNQMNKDISRNALCPCGSGKKYKRCCGKL
jgi:preprotein translocase subunit SecA